MGFHRCALLVCILVFVPVLSFAQDCLDYGQQDFFVPTPLETVSPYWEGVVAVQGSFICWGEAGVYRLSFSDGLEGILQQLSTHDSRCISVSGDLLASIGEDEVELISLAQGPENSFVEDLSDAVCHLEGSLLLVWNTTTIKSYDVSDPTEPELLGSAEFDFPLSLVNPVASSVVMADRLYTLFSKPGNGISWPRGGVLVFDIRKPDDVVLLDAMTEVPFEADGGQEWDKIMPWRGRLMVLGSSCRGGCYYNADHTFVAEVFLDREDHLRWGRHHLIAESQAQGMTTWHDRILLSVTRMSVAGNYGKMFELEVPEFSPDPGFRETYLGGLSGDMAALPDRSLLYCRGQVFSMGSLNHRSAADPAADRNSRGTKLIMRGDKGFRLRWWNGNFPYSVAGWSFGIYRQEDGELVGLSGAGEDWATVEDFSLIGDRVYLDQGYEYLDVSDPENTTGPHISEFNPDGVGIEWDGYAIFASDDRWLRAYQIGDDQQLSFVWSRVNAGGQLSRVGDYLYSGGLYRTEVFDLSSPDVPWEVCYLGAGGVYKAGPDQTLIKAKDSHFTWYDNTDPEQPLLLGTWDLGSTIDDFQVSGNTVYVALDEEGLLVLHFDPALGFAVIGGDMGIDPRSLRLWGSRLWAGGIELLPLDCADPLPTFVSGFKCAPGPAGMEVSWRTGTTETDPGVFRLFRLSAGRSFLVAEIPVRAGESRIVDDALIPGEGGSYSLQLCGEAGSCRHLASAGFGPQVMDSSAVGLVASPNPANPGTMIQFGVDRTQEMNLSIYSLDGRLVKKLVQGVLIEGDQSIFWDGTDSSGRLVASGTYIVSLETETRRFNDKIVVAK